VRRLENPAIGSGEEGFVELKVSVEGLAVGRRWGVQVRVRKGEDE
jgi:hypothetical protein